MASPIFWQSVFLYVSRPNLINKRFIGAELNTIWTFSKDDLSQFCNETFWKNQTLEDAVGQFGLEIFKLGTKNIEIKFDFYAVLKSKSNFFILRKLFRKKSLKVLQREANEEQASNDCEYDITLLFPGLNQFAIIPIELSLNGHMQIKRDDSVAFSIGFDGTDISISYFFDFSSNYWVENILTKKLEHWMQVTPDDTQVSNNELKGSIQGISVESYCATYNRLKSRYSVDLFNIWNKIEKTDPIKFIFEDVAIAAYLITLWEEERVKLNLSDLQTFIDVGCGNGLLVYILTNEGYQGCGIDIRKRNIWDHYGNNVKLIEMQIDLFNKNVVDTLPSCDWMIGNHSDELTPWIIYLSANKSSSTRAFILPCCCYDFDGFKFQRTFAHNKSQYQNYIDFLEKLAHDFGFKTFRDKLRIPSTKRICLICSERSYENTAHISNDKILSDLQLVESQFKLKRKSIVDERLQMRANLRLRDKEETVRNCTQIDQKVKDAIIKRLTSHLISNSDGITFVTAISLLDDVMKNNLKKQCGGLQTFIRNHRHIFTVSDNLIRFQHVDHLRYKAGRKKVKECWFYYNHPNKCPLNEDQCSYLHTFSPSLVNQMISID